MRVQVTPPLLESLATVAVIVVAWPGFTEVRVADNEIVIGTPTGVPLPPHADKKANPATNTIAENARTLPPLPNVIGASSLGKLSGIVGSAGKCMHVTSGLNY